MSTEEQVSSNSSKFLVPGIALVVVIAGVLWFVNQEEPKPTPPPVVQEPVVTQPEPVIEEPEPIIEEPEPVEEVVQPEPEPEVVIKLPLLDESDPEVRKDLLEAAWHQDFAALLVSEDLVRKAVVFVDNVAQGNVERDFSIFKGPARRFSVVDVDGQNVIDSSSYSRYDIYVSLLESMNENDLRRLFDKYQPLIQEVYAELGYPDRDFKDTLIQAIDEALDTPELTQPIEVVSPKVMYKFKDEELEGLSPVQKQLLRMGPDNAKKVKAVLVKYRRSLIAD